jgi:hypothetical protein
MLAQAGYKENIPRPLGRPPSAAAHVIRLEASGSKHWPVPCAKQVRCRVCSARCENRRVLVKCRKCDVGLCVDRSCFEYYHTKAHLWNFSGCARWTSLHKTWASSINVSKRNGIFWNLWKFTWCVHHFPQSAAYFFFGLYDINISSNPCMRINLKGPCRDRTIK